MTTKLLLMLIMIGCSLTAAAAAPSKPSRDKPWADDPASFLNTTGTRNWVVGRSTGPCLSSKEAMQEACADASQQLVNLLGDQLPADADWHWLQHRLTSELSSGRLIEDRAVAVEHKPYGDIWSAAVLVDGSSGQLHRLAAEYSRILGDRRVTRSRQLLSVAGLWMAVLATYALLNWLTKGYFRGRLRLTSAALLLVVGLIGAAAVMHG
jgi:hypothetical protein